MEAGRRASEERAMAERMRKSALSSCLASADMNAKKAIVSNSVVLRNDIMACGSIAAGFSGQLSLNLGFVTISAGFSPDAKVAHCTNVATAYSNSRVAAIELTEAAQTQACESLLGD